MDHISILILYILFSLLIQNITSNYVFTDFNYVKTIELQNENVLMCSEKGVFLCEADTGEINPIEGPLFENDIAKEDFDFVTIAQFEDGDKYIIVAYKTLIYIFTSEGGYCQKSEIQFTPQGGYYTLVPYKVDIISETSKEYYFLIGHLGVIGESMILISQYCFNENIFNLGDQQLLFKDVNNQRFTTYRGFSCQIMKSNTYNEVLTCFVHINNDLVASSFNLNDFSLIEDLTCISEESTNPININSKISNDKTKSLVCYLQEWQNTMCEEYDINKNNFTLKLKSANLDCSNLRSSSSTLYNSIDNSKYIFGCLGTNSDLVFIRFNSNFEVESMIKNNEYIYNDNGLNCISLSIMKTIHNNDHSILAGCESNGVLYRNDLPEGSSLGEQESPINYETSEITILSKIETTVNQVVEKTPYFLNNKSTQIIIYSSEIIKYSTEKTISSAIIINESQKEQLHKSNNIYESTEYVNIEKNKSCSGEYLYQDIYTKECLKSCSSEDLLNKKCKINIITNNSNFNDITDDIRKIINEENITSSDTNIIIEGENTIYLIITNLKMAENQNTNMTIIDLGDCAQKLLEIFQIDYLLILKIDSKLNENTAVIINYEIYNPKTNKKLNLSICNDMKIYTYSSYYPSQESLSKIKYLSEFGYELYDINNDFYQDICSTFTSKNGTDILLSDRKSDFYENMSLCENDCEYKGYDLEKNRVKCECPVKEEISVEQKETPKNILEDFFDGSNFSNIKLLKCFKLVFSYKGQNNNIGSFIFLSIIFVLIILWIIYEINQEKYIIRNITRINKEKYKISYQNNLSNTINNHNYQINKENFFPPKRVKNKFKSNKNNNIVIFSYINNNNNNATKSILDLGKTEEKIKYDTYNFISEELNSLSYDLAFIYDKRTYFQYYISLLKQKHLIIFTFFNNQDYNIFILKLSLFISSFALYFTINALFFNDKTMHEIYKQSGNGGIISQISNIFYSTIISCFINIIIKKLGLSNNDMVKIKQIKNTNESLKQSSLLFKKLKIKFIIFFIIIFILVTFFWYYIAAFCAVYKNTQKILIENTLSSFSLSLLYPFGINLIPGIFRIQSLKSYSGCSKYAYFISKLLALI